MVEAVYLDTNAVSYLFKNPWHEARRLECLRRQLREDLRGGRLEFLTSIHVLAELSRIYRKDPALFKSVLDEILYLSESRIVREVGELTKVEARRKGGLRRENLFLDADRTRGLLDRLQDERFLQANDEAMHQETEKFLSEEKKARKHIGELLKDTREDLTEEWFRNKSAVIESWCRDFMREKRREWRLPRDERNWSHPTRMLSLWNLVSYHIARIYWIYGLGRKLDPSDKYDAAHFACSAYADVLVTSDKGLIAKAGLTGVGRLRITRFRDWVDAILLGLPVK